MGILLLHADARAIPLPTGYVHTVITSPPYWGLRNYGVVGEIGSEGSPEAYVASLLAVFQEIWRVLREDGTCWLNLGDSYANDGKWGGETGGKQAYLPDADRKRNGREKRITGLKPKELVGIPWRVAFALQAAGWYLRSDIIWSKPNPMPESVLDRPTRSHEYIFLLTKRPRYYYDAEAVRETAIGADRVRADRFGGNKHGASTTKHSDGSVFVNATGRNRRSVWTITPKPYRGAHFATFPPELVEPCLLAGSSPEVCVACGAPYQRQIEKGGPKLDQQQACGGDQEGHYDGVAQKDYASGGAQDPSAVKARILAGMTERRTIGWAATCACDEGTAPAVILDPFGGSGTTAMVADRHGRLGISLDLKGEYCRLAAIRTGVVEAPQTTQEAVPVVDPDPPVA